MLGGLAGSALGRHPAVWWIFEVGMFRAAVPDFDARDPSAERGSSSRLDSPVAGAFMLAL
jgi:hypothetical protein